MTAALMGGLLGLGLSAGLLLVARSVGLRLSGPSLADRVDPYLADVTAVSRTTGPRSGPLMMTSARQPASGPAGVWRLLHSITSPYLRAAASRLESLLGGGTAVRRRLARAGSDLSLEAFRVEQVAWGLGAFLAATAVSALALFAGNGRAGAWVVVCACSAVGGVVLRDQRLSIQATRREARMLAEFPAVAELLALSVAAGEGPVGALERVANRCRGDLPSELAAVLAEVRTGVPVTRALDNLVDRTGLAPLARFAEAFSVALERGTPLAEVLQAQAADVRDRRRRGLIESGARKEVFMLVPVVFVILPTTVLFAFFPGMVGLDLVTP